MFFFYFDLEMCLICFKFVSLLSVVLTRIEFTAFLCVLFLSQFLFYFSSVSHSFISHFSLLFIFHFTDPDLVEFVEALVKVREELIGDESVEVGDGEEPLPVIGDDVLELLGRFGMCHPR